MLGTAENPSVWPTVTLTLENCIESVVIGGAVTVILTVVVKNVVITCPSPIVLGPECPTSIDVVYGGIVRVVVLPRLIGGRMSIQGGEHVTVGWVQTWLPT
jgi:hypothetical protein